jgi:hypothetical protein
MDALPTELHGQTDLRLEIMKYTITLAELVLFDAELI